MMNTSAASSLPQSVRVTFLLVLCVVASTQIWHSILVSRITVASEKDHLSLDPKSSHWIRGSATRTTRHHHNLTVVSEPVVPLLQQKDDASLDAVPKTSLGQLRQFMAQYPKSAGARFIILLQNHLHAIPMMEQSRISACRTNLRGRKSPEDLIHCLTGIVPTNSSANDADKGVFMPLNSTISVYDMPCYHGNNHWIPALGTLYSCLPLYLAGAAARPTSMVLELGPYFGLSSKCIVTGMKTQGIRENSFIAFDTFVGKNNYQSIQREVRHSWILESYPQFNENSTSFLFLWEKAVQPIYPKAEGRAGLISETTLNYERIGLNVTNDDSVGIDLISIDSAKSVRHLQDQLAGLGRLKAGTILFLLDFEFVRDQVQLVYGCMRHTGYLLPVYTAWMNHENWAFVVMRDFSFREDFAFPGCVQEAKDIGMNSSYWIEQDLHLLASLGQQYMDNNEAEASMAHIRDLSSKLRKLVEPAEQ